MTTLLTPRTGRALPWGSMQVRGLIANPTGAAPGQARATTTREAMMAAGLDWEVTLGRMFVHAITAEGVSQIEVPERYAVQRTDTGDVVGVVGERYEPMFNRSQAEWTDTVLDFVGEDGSAVMGVTKDGGMGCKVYTAVEIPGDYRPQGMEDEALRVFLFTSNAFDGSTAFQASFAAWRKVCVNGMHVNVKDLTTTWTIRHTASLDERLTLARDAVREAAAWGHTLVVDAEAMLAVPLPPEKGVSMVRRVFPLPELKVDDNGKELNAKAVANAEKRQDAILEVWNTMDDLANIRYTGYGLFQAVSAYNDWGRAYRSDPMDRLLARPQGGNGALNRVREAVLALA